ncbi:hypothetical protein NGI46_11220 [Peribacillus butanolivorans]|uniref:hypothetical protein n=1 Tax=Peribacillus butanolivorans TaxID=421767 RepID=UPI00207C6190|nr:hypothetical protein [Peribacillus butanolivorans]MCO0598031.1 hypothetical protein [Peribacillus butanolivorans]
METNALFYKIQKRTISTEDYVNWSHNLLKTDVSSPSVNIISSFPFDENIFEVEVYFKRALNELVIEKPTLERCARAYIGHLANEIIKENNHSLTFDFAYMIYRIVASDLDYPNDLMEWYEISEMIDELRNGDIPLEFNENDVISRIKNEAGKYFIRD